MSTDMSGVASNALPHHKSLYRVALLSHLLLLGFMACWYLLLAPAEYSMLLAMLLWVVPLMLPLPGLLKANPYTFAWSGFVLMLILCHALTALVVSSETRGLAIIELILVTVALVSGSMYARHEGRHRGLGIRKKKKERKT